METLTRQEWQSRIRKKRISIASSQGNLLPVLGYYGEIDYEAAKKGFSLRHVFVLRWVFVPDTKNKTPEEVLVIANDFLKEQIRIEEIYKDLDKRIAEKKKLGLY